MKQTAVQYFAQKAMTLNISPKEMRDFIKWLEEAKQMEKEEIIQSHIKGQFEWDYKPVEAINKKLAEQYYKETYENNEKTS